MTVLSCHFIVHSFDLLLFLRLMWIPALGVRVLWLRQINSHGLQSPVEEKGQHGLSLSERGRRPLPRQAFIAFLGTLRQGWSSFTMHRFTLGGYLLQITKERDDANYIKEGYLQMQGKKWLNWLHSLECLA